MEFLPLESYHKSPILMSKASLFLLPLSLIMIFYWSSCVQESSLLFNFMCFFSESFLQHNFSFNVGVVCSFFLLMVFLVVCFVCSYSGVYMEHYNNPKFMILLLSFFFSMFMLSLSSSYIVLMLGWDGLGITSILLIMFYPNSNTLYNSILTMFFNRLGDVLLILVLSMFAFSFSLSMSTHQMGAYSIFVLTVCAFSKSAQFPLSSWLPAAMSAPTPISAMVHSSTLVTAGVFVILYFSYWLGFSGMLILITYASMATFLIGGMSANMEKDLKKIVAFSTMSQISMIFCFVSLGFLILGCFHTVFHAFFKTMLFCIAGLMFVYNFSDQVKKHLFLPVDSKTISYFLFLSLFGMTGLAFSSSFFSKDILLEHLFNLNECVSSFVFMSGSIMTLLYCCSLFVPLISSGFLSKMLYFKGSSLIILSIFSLTILVFPTLSCPCLFESNPLLSSSVFFFIVGTFMLVILLKLAPFSSFTSSLSFFISGMKIFSYSIFSAIFKSAEMNELLSNSDLFLKNTNFSAFKSTKSSNLLSAKGILYSSVFLSFLLLSVF